jgi:hypothetical protein
LRNQTDIFGNIGVSRASPLAIDDLVVVVRIVNVRGFHTYILSIRDGDRRTILV